MGDGIWDEVCKDDGNQAPVWKHIYLDRMVVLYRVVFVRKCKYLSISLRECVCGHNAITQCVAMRLLLRGGGGEERQTRVYCVVVVARVRNSITLYACVCVCV